MVCFIPPDGWKFDKNPPAGRDFIHPPLPPRPMTADMCGRFVQYFEEVVLAKLLGLDALDASEVWRNFNAAPTQSVAAVRLSSEGKRQLVPLRWGLVPSWSTDLSIGYKLINARAETAHEKASFRSAFKHRRCLLPAAGFFEWTGKGKQKQPYFITGADGIPLVFAGLWERWERGASPVESCTILTTSANEMMRTLHSRMPVILAPANFDRWLQNGDRELLRPCPDDALRAFPVSQLVNNVRNNSPDCLLPLG
jgi:putative SOS response-associated peptidase YedK